MTVVSVAVFGPPDACITSLREVPEARAELIQLSPLFDETEQKERLGAEIRRYSDFLLRTCTSF
jgi:hypothetical protein